MENNENFVAEQAAENVEQTTEQTPKMFTQEEVNEIVGKAKARTRAKGISTSSLPMAKTNVFLTASQYLPERVNTRTKLSRPTKVMVP